VNFLRAGVVWRRLAALGGAMMSGSARQRPADPHRCVWRLWLAEDWC